MQVQLPRSRIRRAGTLTHLTLVRHSTIMHHDSPCVRAPSDLALPAEPSGGASGQASDITIHAKEILRAREQLTRIYRRRCSEEGGRHQTLRCVR